MRYTVELKPKAEKDLKAVANRRLERRIVQILSDVKAVLVEIRKLSVDWSRGIDYYIVRLLACPYHQTKKKN